MIFVIVISKASLFVIDMIKVQLNPSGLVTRR